MTNGVTPETEIQKGSQGQNTEELAPADTPKVDFEARHKEAQDALSRKAEENIKTNVKLATLDPKEILGMETKMQNKIISDIYGYNNLDELKTMNGDEFWKSGDEQDLTESQEMAKRLKVLEHQNKRGEIDRAIENYQKDNSKVFEDDAEAAMKLSTELAFISETLPAKERVERAGKILFGENYVDNTTSTYLSMQDTSISAGANGSRPTGTKQDTSFADFAKNSGFLK